jgi:hypothetical protein
VGDIAVAPDGRVYLALEHKGLGVLDRGSRSIRVVSQAQCPKTLALSPDGRVLWVAYQCGGPGGSAGREAIGRFDAATGKFLGAIAGFPQVGGPIAVSADGSQVWANAADACLAEWYTKAGCSETPARLINIIDAARNRRVDAISFAGFDLAQMSASPDGSAVVIGGSEGMLFFDPATRQRLGTFPIPANSVTFTADGARGYASVPAWRQIVVLGFIARADVAVAPDGDGNIFKRRSANPLAVTVTSSEVNVTNIDPETVTLGGVAAERKSDGKLWASAELGRDGRQNQLIMRFARRVLSDKLGDSELVLAGRTGAGVRVRGSARVRVLP